NTARVNGVTIQVAPDGAVWFLESSADIIARFKDGVMRQWPIRTTDQLGANPVVFQLDGDIVWFIESGESLIPAATSAFARLDTTTGALTEWVIPGTIPATFYRSPDGLTLWLPQSGSVLQSMTCSLPTPTSWVNCPTENLQVTNYRSPGTYAYADMVLAPDGAFWLADFGDNRIVRWVPGALTETSWTYLDYVTFGRTNPSQIALDTDGTVWIAQRSADRIDHFDPVANLLYSYTNIVAPIHFELFEKSLYITQIATTSSVTVLDPSLAVPTTVTQVGPETLSVGNTLSIIPVAVRNTTIVPVDFSVVPVTLIASQFTVANPGTTPGLLTTTFPSSNTYGITVSGGRLWVGTDTQLVALNLQAAGADTDQSVPMATTLSGTSDSKIQIELTASNTGASTLSTQALFLYSLGSFTPRATFTIAPNATNFLADSYPTLAGNTTLLEGPVRFTTTSGTVADLRSTVRSARVLPGGGTFGYLFPSQSATTSLLKDSTTTLFTGAESTHVSILNLYSLVDAQATLSLFAPDGTMRGTQDFAIAKNASLSFNPAASAFGVPAEPGDAIRVTVTDGTLQSSVLVFDAGTTDVLPSLPAAASTSAVVPWIGDFANGDRSFATDLYLSNPSPDTGAEVTLTFYGVGSTGAAPTATLALAPLETQAITDVLLEVFGIAAGQGALTVDATQPVAASIRVATRVAAGDYGTFANAIDAAGGVAGGTSAIAVGLPQTSTRSGLLLLYNAGVAGTVTVNGFKADGTPAGQLSVPLGDHASGVVGPVFAALGVTNQPAGRVRLDVPAGMNVFGWAAAVDDVTGDFDLTPLQ
ncbi:MAG TPA: hypothetical protein VGG65_03745, partial [Thermoanaerobaculia bacterium]